MRFLKQYPAIYIFLDFSFAKEPETERNFDVELTCFDMLITNNFYIKETFQFYVASTSYILRSPCVQTPNSAISENS